jgi:hypothetical protein
MKRNYPGTIAYTCNLSAKEAKEKDFKLEASLS